MIADTPEATLAAAAAAVERAIADRNRLAAQLLAGGYTVRALAAELDVSHGTVHNWAKAAQPAHTATERQGWPPPDPAAAI